MAEHHVIPQTVVVEFELFLRDLTTLSPDLAKYFGVDGSVSPWIKAASNYGTGENIAELTALAGKTASELAAAKDAVHARGGLHLLYNQALREGIGAIRQAVQDNVLTNDKAAQAVSGLIKDLKVALGAEGGSRVHIPDRQRHEIQRVLFWRCECERSTCAATAHPSASV